MRRHLAAKDIEPEAARLAIEQLRDQGYLDDARYARRFAEDRRALDHWGRERIELRLRALGVEPELIEAALARRDAAGELEGALELLRRRYRAPLTDPRERNRALGLLLRRGYESELAYEAVRAHSRDAAA